MRDVIEDANKLFQLICELDGNNRLGASELAWKLVEQGVTFEPSLVRQYLKSPLSQHGSMSHHAAKAVGVYVMADE